MIKYYPDDIPFENTHIVEMTYLFGKDKLVLRGRISGDCQGVNAINHFSDYSGFNIDGTLEVVEGFFRYFDDEDDIYYDTVDVSIDGQVCNMTASDMQRYLVKVEIVDVR